MQDGYSAGEEYWGGGRCLSSDLQAERGELRMKREGRRGGKMCGRKI